MASCEPPVFQSGDLSICPDLGQVTNIENETVRFGPVNMKVLSALVERAGRVVSRGELFEAVWGNQIVGEDALTRCISDIRAELKKLSGRDDLIETLPKRGYRWRLEARVRDSLADPQSGLVDTGAQSDFVRAAPPRPRGRVVRFAARGLTYLLALVVMAVAGVWLADRFARPDLQVVAVLPVAVAPAQSDLGMRVESELTDQLMALGDVQLLSRSAVESRPENPFPFFFYEFGARWVIEAEVQHVSGRDVLTLAVVDARTGIVLTQQSEPVVTAPDGVADSISKSLRVFEPLLGPGSAERR